MTATLRELLARPEPCFSFEFFPPKTDQGEANLWQTIRDLEPLGPTFVSVTCRAAASTHERTIRLTERIAAETTITPVAHITCAGLPIPELRQVARRLQNSGIRNVLALRGDPTGGLDAEWEAVPDGFTYAEDLVGLLRAEGDFSIGVAAFPEGHPESPDRETDVKYLARKVSAGADFAVTQFFFDASDYFRLVEMAREVGCDVPIIPGVIPVTNVAQIERFAKLSGAAFPPDLAARLHAVEDDADAVREIGVDVATQLCGELLAGGAPGIHFYTLNRSPATREIWARLGLDR